VTAAAEAERKKGSDTICMNIYDYAEAKGVSTRQILDFTLPANPLGPSAKTKHAMRKALKATDRPPDPRTRYLRGFIARKERIQPENILFGHGSTQILDLLLASLKPKKILAPSPLPAWRARLLDKRGAQVVPVALSESSRFIPDVEELLSRLKDADMLLIPNPHPLAGTVLGASALSEIARVADASGKALVVDEALAGFVRVDSPVEAALHSANALILRTFSFFHALAGMRLGYAIGSQRILDLVAGIIDPGEVSAVAAAGALASLRDKSFPKRTAEFLATEKAYMTARLGRIKGISTIDTACNFLLVAPGSPVGDLRSRFLQRNILTETFRTDEGREMIHLPLRRRRDNARFAAALARIMAEEPKA